MDDESFFEPLSDDGTTLTVRTTTHPIGPWDPRALHAGPPSALLHAAMRRHHPPEGRLTTRITFEILRPVPVGELRATTEVRRPGGKVELVHATLRSGDGKPVMTAAEWRIRSGGPDLGVGIEGAPLPGPDGIEASTSFFREVPYPGYVEAMEVRFVKGGWSPAGPAIGWMRMRPGALIAGEAPTGVDRLLVAADSGNGISARAGEGTALGPDGLFINVDLTVHLVREPVGEWIGLDAHTVLTDHGIGLAHSELHDQLGPVGRASQSLLVDRP